MTPNPRAGHIYGEFGPPPEAWQAPTDIERELYEAKLRGDWAAYFDVLAKANLYHTMSRSDAEDASGKIWFTPYWEPGLGVHCLAFLTEGVLPAPVPDPVFFSTSLGWLAEAWPKRHDRWLAVNPGTPCEAYFPATLAHQAVWQQHAANAPKQEGKRLRTLRVGGPLQGPVAHGLACGALLCVNNGGLWNAMARHGFGFRSERNSLREWWGITTREQWRESLERLLMGQVCSPVWEFVLEVRRSIAREYGGPVEPAYWREVTAHVMRSRVAESGGSPAEANAEIARLQQLIGRITRYEARFRADGLLSEGRQVRSVLAWDYGRASNMGRWGLGARFCDISEAESAVVRAGRVSQVSYNSWEDFAIGFVLGRCLHFDEEEFGSWYRDMVDVHHVLFTDPESPWLTIPWK